MKYEQIVNFLYSEQIEDNYKKFIKVIETFSVKRQEQLNSLYQTFDVDEKLILAPASDKVWNGGYPGGYIHRILNVIKICRVLFKAWEHLEYQLDFTLDELLFVALNHDVGRLGTYEHEAYILVTDNWKKKRGLVYEPNPLCSYMKFSDRSLWLLSKFNVEMSESEYYGILLSDGFFSDDNQDYFRSFNPNHFVQSNLPFIIAQAVMMNSRSDYERYKNPVKLRKIYNDDEIKLNPKREFSEVIERIKGKK